MPWDETDEYIRSGHRDPDSFDKDSFRTITLSEDEGIRAVVGCPKGHFEGGKCNVGMEIQTYLFDKSKGWTMSKAKEWFEKHKEGIIGMGEPFAGYKDFADCVAKNKDKDNPEAYCAAIKHRVEEAMLNGKKILYLFGEGLRVDGVKVFGVAIHPKKLWHPEEGTYHVYLEEELKKAAPTLAGKPFGIDHIQILPKPNVVERSWWDDQLGGVAFEGTVSPEIAERIKKGEFKGVSIELNWFKPGVMLEKVNGIAPRNFDFTAVHFMKNFPPADKETFVKVWEGITLPIVPPPLDVQIEQLKQWFAERLSYLEGQVNALLSQPLPNYSVSTSGQPATTAVPPAPTIIIVKEAAARINAELNGFKEKLNQQLEAIKEAATKKEKELKEDLEHKKDKVLEMIEKYEGLVKQLDEKLKGIKPESDTVIELRKKLTESEKRIVELEKEKMDTERNFRLKYENLRNSIIEALPPPAIWRAWKASGPKLLVQKLYSILGIQPNQYEG